MHTVCAVPDQVLLLTVRSPRRAAPLTQAVSAIVNLLDSIDQLVTDTPPVDNGKSRFGNPAFKDFYDKAQQVRRMTLLMPARLPRTG